jgi:hypothetical protein
MKTAGRENPNPWLTALKHTEFMARTVRTISLNHGGLGSKKNSGHRRSVFS